ncbi:MAG TPA: AI-2E family transporter [Candidatus Obscuribacterales bacterium]
MVRWVAFFLLIWFMYQIREIFPPFVVGAVIAYLLLPLVRYVSQQTKMPISAAVLMIYLLIGGAIFGLCWFFGPQVIDQATNLVNQRQEMAQSIVSQVSTAFGWQMTAEEVQKAAQDLLSNLEQNVGTTNELVHIGGLLSKGFLGVLVCVVSSIYLIADSHRVGQFFLRFVPPERRDMVTNITQQTNVMLSRYVRGQIILITIMSTVAWIFLHFGFKLKYALVIAIASGFLEIIPVLGPILATSIATIVGVAQHGIGVAVGIIACYMLARWAEDFLIIPRIIGHAVELHPLIVIFAVLCGEVMAGALGMLIAIPVAACIKLIIDFFYPPVVKTSLPPAPELAPQPAADALSPSAAPPVTSAES